MPFQIAHGHAVGAGILSVSSLWWQRGNVPSAGQCRERSLVDIFQSDFELPFETAFWGQPAWLMADSVPGPRSSHELPGFAIVARAPLAQLLDDVAHASAADRSHYTVLLADGRRFGGAEMEALMEDAALR